MRFLKPLFVMLAAASFLACKTATNSEQSQYEKTKLPEILQKAIEAHGGLEKWQSMQTLEFVIERNEKPQKHIIDLPSRKVRISDPDYTLVFDGEEVYVSPNLAAFGNGSPRFFHNLYFYFFAFPFILADPGINYEVLPPATLNGKTYDALKVTYGSGVGDAPDDVYIAHFDQNTHKMEVLLYTVTYYQGEPSDKYNALIYSDWQEVNGLQVPKVMSGYKYAEGEIGDKRYDRMFSKVSLSQEAQSTKKFIAPVKSELAPLGK